MHCTRGRHQKDQSFITQVKPAVDSRGEGESFPRGRKADPCLADPWEHRFNISKTLNYFFIASGLERMLFAAISKVRQSYSPSGVLAAETVTV